MLVFSNALARFVECPLHKNRPLACPVTSVCPGCTAGPFKVYQMNIYRVHDLFLSVSFFVVIAVRKVLLVLGTCLFKD